MEPSDSDAVTVAPPHDRPVEHADVLVIGAGLSGVGAASRLQARRPGDHVVIVEARERMGGTWDLFRYPGVRSDSDMYTLGYDFAPWEGEKSIADGPDILDYIERTAREQGVAERIRFGHRVTRLDWDDARARWNVELRRRDGDVVHLTAGFVYACTGYYRYDAGYTPDLPGLADFAGRLIHPQHWPADLDVAGRRIVVVGSGATAVTLVPALAARGAQVTMLQRSPGYVVSFPDRDPVAEALRHRLPDRLAHALIKWKNVLGQSALWELAHRAPGLTRRLLLRGVARRLPAEVDLEPHFAPRYDPWDQRVCVVPRGDLFTALREGGASIVTDTIATFVPEGVRLDSGHTLEADAVVTATGLELLFLGGITVTVDGREVDVHGHIAHRGMMLSGVPNLAFAFGYVSASWTLRVDLVSEQLCRLLDHMEARGFRVAIPDEPGPEVERRPLIELTSGYLRRAIDGMPTQGARDPWVVHQSYVRDVLRFRWSDVGKGMTFRA